MPYTPTTWVDGTTPLNATNMNHIESGISGVGNGIPTGGATSQVVGYGGSSGTGSWVLPPGYEFDYVEITSNVSTTGTVTAITGNAVTYDGSTRVKIDFYSPAVTIAGGGGANAADVHLYDGSTDLGNLGELYSDGIGTGQLNNAMQGAKFLTPTAGSHTYLIKLTRSNGSGTVYINAGAGGTATFMPAYMRITKA